MRNLDRQPRANNDVWMRFVILVLAALLLMALQITGRLRPLQSFASLLTSPAQLGTTGIARTITNGVSFLLELRTLRQRNAVLEELNASLRAENFTLREVERENETMRNLLRFANTRPGLELRGAQIVGQVLGQESNNFLKYLTIDLGARHGLKIGMPVLTDQGLVGRISEVNDSTADVLLITDPNSAVNAFLEKSRANGVLQGAPGGDLIMDFIPQSVAFSVGEVVFSSGIGARFPKGIPIGVVIERRQRDIDISQQAVIRPIIDFSALELVAVVTNFDPLENIPGLPVLAPTPTAAPTEASTNGGDENLQNPIGVEATPQPEPRQAP